MVDVLAFGAHPDDVELGCAGTMLRFHDAGLSTAVVDLTAGERGSRGTRETRAAEAEQASRLLGLSARECLDFPDTELEPTLALRRAVVEAIRRHRPRVVLAPLPGDLHPDHDAAGRAVVAAFYPSGMKNLAADGAPHRPARLLHYFMHDEADTALVMDVTPVWDRRIAAARCFASQLHGGAAAAGGDFPTLIAQPDFLDRLEARARVWGRRAGVTFGEPLVVRGALPIADPSMLLV
jgi:bacillithiol biosynthesis deacetylase BshB1